LWADIQKLVAHLPAALSACRRHVQGYWRDNSYKWPVTHGMWLGNKWYSHQQCQTILRNAHMPGDHLSTLCKELITAKLNSVINPPDEAVQATIQRCDALVGDRVPGVHMLSEADTADMLVALREYNDRS
jgi:hypothetical protein